MTRPTLNTIGFRCPACNFRLVSRGSCEYRCAETEGCGALYAFTLDALEGITLTLMEERYISTRRDALQTTPIEGHQEGQPRLSLVEGDSR